VWTLIGDNLDLESKRKKTTRTLDDISRHFFHVIAGRSRVPRRDLDNTRALGRMLEAELLDVLPNNDDFNNMKQVMAALIGRMLVPRLKWMSDGGVFDCRGLENREILHAYSKEMATASCEVPVGLTARDRCLSILPILGGHGW
jgi:hypothetical protein